MDDFSVREERDFHNLTAKPRRMHLLDEPSEYISALAKDCLAHQMRFSVGRLESELLAEGTPHVLQIAFEGGDDRTPAIWTLYADGDAVAHGTGEFAHECFCESATGVPRRVPGRRLRRVPSRMERSRVRDASCCEEDSGFVIRT